MTDFREARAMRHGFELCLCPGPHPFPLTWDRHHLWPTGWDGPDASFNLARACPNAHRLTHTLLNRMKRAGGLLPHREAIRFGRYPVRMAELGWQLMAERLPAYDQRTFRYLPDLHE